MKSRFLVLLALMLFLLSSCSLAEDITPPANYQSPTPAPTMSPLFPANTPDTAAGAAIFASECAPCHGEKGLGDGVMASKLQKPPAALGKLENARAAAPANWFTTVTQGNMQSFMPPFNTKLSDQQRWDVVAYAISLGIAPDEITKGKDLYEVNCSQCHGADGKANPQADLSDQAALAKLTQNDIAGFVSKGIGTMPGFGGAMADPDIYAVAAYVRTFTFPIGQPAAAVVAATPSAADATPASTPAEAGSATPEGTPAPDVSVTPTAAVGSISGKVINGSGSAVPTGLKAVLHAFDHDTTTQQFSEAATQESPVAADGSYQFTNLSMAATCAYYVSVDFSGTTYESDPAIPQQDGKTSYDLPVTIYETTTDTSALEAEQVHVILDYSKPDVIQVIEFYIITNPGNKTVVPAEKGGPVSKISLPKGYTNLQFEQGALGDRYIKTDDGFADTSPVAPNAKQYQIVFAFDLPRPQAGLFGGQKLEFTQPIAMKVNAVSVLVPEGVSVANLTPGGVQDMGNGANFQVYTAASMEPGKSLEIVASGTPKTAAQAATTTPATNTTQNVIIGVGALGVVLILIGGWLFWRDRKRAAEDDNEEFDNDEEDDVTGEEDIDEVMDSIVALDDQFKTGNISEEAYKERRAELKAKLKGKL
jgi:mono/diheme cytochrome c family protein